MWSYKSSRRGIEVTAEGEAVVISHEVNGHGRLKLKDRLSIEDALTLAASIRAAALEARAKLKYNRAS
jgi:hypothetical protein